MALPLIPILGGLGLLYLLTRSSSSSASSVPGGVPVEGGGVLLSTMRAANMTDAAVLKPGVEYTMNLQTAGGQPSVYVLTKCLEVDPSGTKGKFEVTNVLERKAPVAPGEPNIEAMLKNGQKPVVIASKFQVEEVINL